MSFIFWKIDNFFYKGNQLFYKKQMEMDQKEKDQKEKNLYKATEFNDKYIYYYDNKEKGEMKTLGKFIKKSKQFSSSLYHDYDYDVYDFEKETVFCDKAEFIFCSVIPESDENMILIPDFLFSNYSIYYKKI